MHRVFVTSFYLLNKYLFVANPNLAYLLKWAKGFDKFQKKQLIITIELNYLVY